MNWLKSFWKALSTPATSSQARELYEPTSNFFTPRAQQVLALARKEADRFNHNFVGTEHLLLGLISLGQGTAVTVLGKLGLNLETVRQEVEKQVGTGPDQKMIGNIPYTPRVKKVLALAGKEAKALNHTYVGTEHILLGLLREGDGVAARVLKNLNVDIDLTRQYILKELDPNLGADPHLLPIRSTEMQKLERELIDLSRRYDVYCREGEREVVYRGALFKGIRALYQGERFSVFYEFIELEQADGRTVFIGRTSVTKFCEHGVTPAAEVLPGKKPV